MTLGINKETIGSVVAVVLVAAGGWYAFTNQPASGGPAAAGAADTVAIVNGQNVTRAELDLAVAQMTGGQGASAATTTEAKAALDKQALDSVIGRTLLLQAATQAGLTASTTAVDAQVAAAVAQLGGQDALDKQLASQGMTAESMRVQISENLTIQAYLEQTLKLSTLTATDAEIKAMYDQLSAGGEGIPALSEVKEQVKQMIIGQKQQELVGGEIEKLRAAGSVQVLI